MAGEGAVELTDARFLVESKVRAELSAADALCPGSAVIVGAGSLTPAVLLVKGNPGEADVSAGVALAGADGEAARKALDALDVTGAHYAVCSRTTPACAPGETGARLRLIIEALDPSLVVALDREAAEDISSALGIPALMFGEPVSLPGRTLLAVDGLEASLADDRKAVVWQQFRGLRRT